MDKIYIGIDPGITGACVLIYPDRIDFFDWPGDVKKAKVLLYEKIWINGVAAEAIVGIENVHSFPGQGLVSTSKFMRNFGIWEGLVAGISLNYILIQPKQWQKTAIVSRAGKNTKENSIASSKILYPDVDFIKLKKHHNRADALLIAHYIKSLDELVQKRI